MKVIAILLFAVSSYAQTLPLTCPTTVKAGTALIAAVSLLNGQGAAGAQFTVTATSSLGTLTASSTGAAASAGKTVYQTGTSVILGGFGPPGVPGSLNSGQMADGVIANLSWLVPASLGNQNVQISIAGGAVPALATSSSGSIIQVTPGPTCAVSVLPSTNFCDIDGNGVVNQADVTAQRLLVVTFPQSATCPRNANGCNVGAIEIVAVAAMGGACTATQ